MDDIEIRVRRRGNDVEVLDSDGRTTGPLCMGETIEQVLGLVFPGQNKTYPMRNREEWGRLARFLPREPNEENK